MKNILLAAALLMSASPVFAVPAAHDTGIGATASTILNVREGCGLGFHRGPFGGCRPNGGPRYFGRACPRGFHLGPAGRACRPNF